VGFEGDVGYALKATTISLSDKSSPMSELGPKPEKLNESKCFPLFTQQRTSPRYFGMSVSCPKRTPHRSKQHLCSITSSARHTPRGPDAQRDELSPL
jgi:hypothetical protein